MSVDNNNTPTPTKLEDARQHQEVTPIALLAGGASIVLASAAFTGISHFTSTTKAIKEEGIDAASRRAAVPVATKALVASSLMCAAMAAAVVGVWKLSGMHYRDVANVSSFDDAIALAKLQRVRLYYYG